MRLLLDTHTFIWLTDAKKGKSIGRRARQLIDAADVVYVSAVTILEIRMKVMRGQLDFIDDIQAEISNIGLILLDFKADHADEISRFPSLERHDPFDRMLLAQASAEDITFCTADVTLLGLHLQFVIDASA